jgi:hypothetical protein
MAKCNGEHTDLNRHYKLNSLSNGRLTLNSK